MCPVLSNSVWRKKKPGGLPGDAIQSQSCYRYTIPQWVGEGMLFAGGLFVVDAGVPEPSSTTPALCPIHAIEQDQR